MKNNIYIYIKSVRAVNGLTKKKKKKPVKRTRGHKTAAEATLLYRRRSRRPLYPTARRGLQRSERVAESVRQSGSLVRRHNRLPVHRGRYLFRRGTRAVRYSFALVRFGFRFFSVLFFVCPSRYSRRFTTRQSAVVPPPASE